MTLKEAIAILQFSLEHGYQPEVEDLNGAVKLSIGGLQQIAQMRLLGISPIAELLPGETEE